MQQLSMFNAATKPKFTVNPDGYSIKGCTIIYAPKGQAGEYAKLSANPFRGCGHKCIYCYVPQVLKMSRQEFDSGAIPRPDFINKLTKDARKYQAANIHEQVMLSFTTDPYNPGDVERQLTRQTIEALKAHGLGFCTLTKGGKRALRDIDLFRPSRDAFATTLTSVDPAISLEWEPGAALPDDRLQTLETFHNRGIYTWVSLEPVFDTEATLEIIQQSHTFVDLYKVGRINYHRLAKEIDWSEFTERVIKLLMRLGARHYIKRDLQPYLPKDYLNPKYRPQFH
jgi:DNA repair photolyase